MRTPTEPKTHDLRRAHYVLRPGRDDDGTPNGRLTACADGSPEVGDFVLLRGRYGTGGARYRVAEVTTGEAATWTARLRLAPR